MIGLVVTSTSSWVQQIVQKFWPFKPEPLSLKNELTGRGVTTYSLEKVRQFQSAYLRKEVDKGRAGSLAKWDRLSALRYEEYSSLVYSLKPIPLNVQRVIDRAQTIPETKVFVEWFDRDPFVFIERRRKFGGFKREICCIGYWDAPGFQP